MISLFVNYLQSEPIILNTVADHMSSGLSTVQIVIISFITYVVGAFVQYLVSWFLRKTDVKNDRKMKIAEISIAQEVDIYKALVKLRGYQKYESKDLLASIQQLQIQLSNDKILFSKQFYKVAQDLVDYFAIIAGDYTRKDVNKELSLFDALYDSFHKQ